MSNSNMFSTLALYTKVATDFCQLLYSDKIQLGISLGVLKFEQLTLTEKDIEIVIWDNVIKNNIFDQFMIEVGKLADEKEKKSI